MIRPLAHGEAALAREVFGRDLRLDDIRFLGSPWPFDRAFVPGRWFGRDWIVWPKATLAPDLSQAPLRTQAVFIHELVHVWQFQHGMNLVLRRHPFCRYSYTIKPGWKLERYGIEQQAEIVRHTFLLRHKLVVPGAPPLATLESILPFGTA